MKLINIGEKGYLVDIDKFNKIQTEDDCLKLLEEPLVTRTHDNLVVDEGSYRILVQRKRESLIKKTSDKQKEINQLRVELATARRALKDASEIGEQIDKMDGQIRLLQAKHEDEIKTLKDAHQQEIAEVEHRFEAIIEQKDKELDEREVGNNELIESLKEENERLRKVEAAYGVQITHITKAHEERACNFDRAKQRYKDKIHSLGQQLETITKHKKELENKIEENQALIEKLRQKLDTQDEQIQQFKVNKEKSDFVIHKASEYYDDFTEFLEITGNEFNKEFDEE